MRVIINQELGGAQRSAAGVSYLYGDQLGSVSFATNANGSSTSRQDFDAWGAVRSGGVSATSLNYTGQRLDSTGLLDYHARLYDPLLARFVSANTIVLQVDNVASARSNVALRWAEFSVTMHQCVPGHRIVWWVGNPRV